MKTLVKKTNWVLAVAFIVTTINSCGRSRTASDREDAAQDDSYEDAATADTREDADKELEEVDAEIAYWDSGLERSTDLDSGVRTLIETDSARPNSPDNDASQPSIRPRPAVTPDDLTQEVLDTYYEEDDKPDKPAQTELQDCGYTMRIDYETQSESAPTESEETGSPEFRYFDQEGRLLLQQSDTIRTEVRYDQRGRPITIWVEVDSFLFSTMRTTESGIIAIGYQSDGSIEVKSMGQMVLNGGHCDYVLFDEQQRVIRRAEDSVCDGVAEKMIDVSYDPQTGRPISYRLARYSVPGYPPKNEEISWSYADDGRRVKAVFTDSYPDYFNESTPTSDKSAITFTYDDADALISVEADYENNGVIDEYANYVYDEQGYLLRQETYIDDDDIIDLLRANTYTDDGRPITQTLRNLTAPGMGMYFYGSDFEDLEPATARTITYTYDNDNRLIQKEIDDTHDTKTERYKYDSLGRLVEQKISVDHFDSDDGTFSGTTNVICTYEFRCDQTTLIESDLHRCELGTPLHYFIFPYRDASDRSYFIDSERTSGFTMIPESSLRTMVGIPWY